MKAAVWYGEKDGIKIEERGNPSLEKGEVLIKVGACGICGTDLMIYKGKFPRSHPPLVPGHEFAGEIVETFNTSSGLKVGDRVLVNPLFYCGKCVACREGFTNACPKLGLIGVDIDGAFAEYVKAKEDKVYKIPSDFPFEEAALVEPAAVAYHTVKIAELQVGDVVVILGAGPIGLLVAMIAKMAGASEVVLAEVLGYRLEFAREQGFSVIDASKTDTVKEIQKITNGKGADVVFDTAGTSKTAGQLLFLVRPKGKITVVGLYKQLAGVDLFNMVIKEASLSGSRVYTDIDFEKVVQLVISGKLNVAPLISHRLSLEETEKGIKLVDEGKDVIKPVVLLRG